MLAASEKRIQTLLSSLADPTLKVLPEKTYQKHEAQLAALKTQHQRSSCAEPLPEKKTAPHQEPTVRIGIIIEEDKKSCVHVHTQNPMIARSSDGQSAQLSAGQDYLFSAVLGRTVITDGANEIFNAKGTVTIETSSPEVVAPKSGAPGLN